jgi:hypothetical protein
MATLLAHVKVTEGKEDHWEEIARTVFAATHANEKAMQRYEYWRGSDPRTYYVLLSFDDFDGFMEHQIADYHHNAPFGDCFEDFKLEWIDPIEGASPLVASTTSGEERPEKGDLWNTYRRNHSEEVPAWWVTLRG